MMVVKGMEKTLWWHADGGVCHFNSNLLFGSLLLLREVMW